MRTWLGHQAGAARRTLRSLAAAPLASAFNVIVVGIALALPVGLYVALANLQTAARAVSPEPRISVFLALDATRAETGAVEARLRAHAEVAGARFIPREEALAAMQRSSAMAGIAEGLGSNPLPDAFVIDARDSSAAALERLRAEIAGWPRVAKTQLDAEWAQRLDAIINLGRMALLLLAGALAFALVAITFNTIRLQILTRRDEIEVAMLIGATDAYIRRPFLYLGAVLGMLGGLAACGLVWGAATLIDATLAEFARLYGASWALTQLTASDAASILAFAAALGWVGAWLSVARHLSSARPR